MATKQASRAREGRTIPSGLEAANAKSHIELMNAQLLVKSMPGTICPKEGKPREYIGDAQAVSVEPSAYYLRLISEGSLIRCEPQGDATESEVSA